MAQAEHTSIGPAIITQVPGASIDWRCKVDGINVEFVRVPDKLRAATLFQFDKRTLSRRALGFDPDIVHAHGTEEAYAMAAQATGKPNVITLQGVFAIINKELPPKLISRPRVVEFLEACTLRKAKHVIAKSDYIAERAAKLFPNLLIHRIPNTFDPRLLSIDTTKVPRSACFVGMITERKGLDLVVDALRQLDKTAYPSKFHVVGNRGSGEADYDRRVLSDLRQLLGDKLVLHGIVPAFEAANIIARCEVLLAPSREEMFGNQLIEALLLRTFPVVGAGTALAENARKFTCGEIISVSSKQDWLTVLRSRVYGRAAEMTQVRDKVVLEMGPAIVAQAHRELYQRIIQSGGR
jgi:glycosyltransferase involved in cell wall biosynthesis